MEVTLEFDKPKDLVRLLFGDKLYAAKDSGNIATSAKFVRTVFPCSSTPNLLGSLSDGMNIRRSPLRLTDSNGISAKPERNLSP
jgi:hypothetical protein